jgi:hypothetical protein
MSVAVDGDTVFPTLRGQFEKRPQTSEAFFARPKVASQ